MTHTKSEELFRRAQEKIPGGVNSPVRAFRSVGGQPRLHRPRRGIAPVRRRRQRIHRLRGILGAAAAGAPASGDPGSAREGAGHRHQLRRADGGGGRTGGRHLRSRAFDRDGAPGEFRHRGDHVGDTRGARLHRPRPHRQIRRLLSRPRRFAAGEGRLGPGDAGHRGHAGRSQGIRRYHDRPALQFAGGVGRGFPRARRAHRGGDRGAGSGQHGLRAARCPAIWKACARSPRDTARC